MTAQAQAALNAIEDSAPQPPKRDRRLGGESRRTFDEAVAYAVSKGYVWLIWNRKSYRIVDGKACAE